MITSLGEARANLSAFCVCSICACLVLSVSSSSWCLGRAAVCVCRTPWTFLLPVFEIGLHELFRGLISKSIGFTSVQYFAIFHIIS